MMLLASCASSQPSISPIANQQPETLELYVVRGDAAALASFHKEIGKDWAGGEFLEGLSSRTEYRYWAYSTRAARDARTFMFGSINHQLRLGFEPYTQATFYPKERAALDEVRERCKLAPDPFFIEPNRTVVVDPGRQTQCVTAELKKLRFGINLKFRNAKPSETRL